MQRSSETLLSITVQHAALGYVELAKSDCIDTLCSTTAQSSDFWVLSELSPQNKRANEGMFLTTVGMSAAPLTGGINKGGSVISFTLSVS